MLKPKDGDICVYDFDCVVRVSLCCRHPVPCCRGSAPQCPADVLLHRRFLHARMEHPEPGALLRNPVRSHRSGRVVMGDNPDPEDPGIPCPERDRAMGSGNGSGTAEAASGPDLEPDHFLYDTVAHLDRAYQHQEVEYRLQ